MLLIFNSIEALLEGYGFKYVDTNLDFSNLLKKAFSKFNCFIPALVVFPNSPQNTTYTRSFNMDQCIFESNLKEKINKKCGGLRFLKRFSSITGNKDFCSRDFGELSK